MSLSQEIAPYLPHLRRYARALSGSQTSGDAYVVELLEALVEFPDAFPRNLDVRIGLYRMFSSLHSPLLCAGLAEVDAQEEADFFGRASGNLASLTARSRQAFLLMGLEGFSQSEIAVILESDLKTVTEWILEAGREISNLIATDVLIIEDVALIAAELSMLMRDLGHSVLGVARTKREAISLTDGRKPGLILADIHLADGSSGVHAVNELLERGEAPVIFITAYPEKLLTGLRPEPTFLITKPYKPDAVKVTVSQSLFLEQRASAPSNRPLVSKGINDTRAACDFRA